MCANMEPGGLDVNSLFVSSKWDLIREGGEKLPPLEVTAPVPALNTNLQQNPEQTWANII